MSAEILQEFVTKLGYHVDEASGKRLSMSLGKVDNLVGGVGKQIAGLAVTTEQAIREFATQMEKVGYSARLADSTSQSITGAGMAVEKFGLQSDQIKGITSAFADLVRHSPGVEAQLSQLGVALDPDKIKEFWNLMQRLETMPENVALQYAQAFQIPSDAYHLMRGHVAEIQANMDAISAKANALGYDMETASKNGQEYSNHVRNIKNNIDLISGKVLDFGLSGALPILRDFDHTLEGIFVTEEQRQKASAKTASDIDDQRNAMSAYDKEMQRIKGGNAPSVKNEPSADQKKTMLQNLESQFGLPSGMLTGIEQQESRGGKFIRSGAGAKGPFQHMPATSAAYGEKDPDDYVESAKTTARIMHDLLQQYKGNAALALAAYNAGPDAVNRYLSGKGNLPAETQAYVPGVAGRAPAGSQMAAMAPVINQNFYGPTDPSKVKTATEDGVNKSLTNQQKAAARNMTGAGPTGRNVS
jgi:hypothetical protein